MIANLHPVMQAALNPFVKRHQRISPTQTFTHVLDGVTLTCQLDYEAGERETRSEPGVPQTATLVSATTPGGDDITPLLSDDHVADIETSFLEQDYEP